MLTDDDIKSLTERATALATVTSSGTLRRIAEITLREHGKLTGDERTETRIMHDAYVAEMQRRGLS